MCKLGGVFGISTEIETKEHCRQSHLALRVTNAYL